MCHSRCKKSGKEVLLNLRCMVKGYHLCRFEENVSEVFTASKKRGEHGNVFKVVNHRRQLGNLQFELVDPLWPLHANATQDCDSGSKQSTESSRKTPKLQLPIAYYYDEKKGTVFFIFCCTFYYFIHNWCLHRFF